MALVTNAFATYDATANREDLTNAIYNIAPTDTPVMSAIARETARNTLHEWQTDTLATATTSNRGLEGDVITRAASTATTRHSNYTQIFRKNATVTHTQRDVDHAGMADMLAYQVAKKAKELKRDIETTILANQGRNVGTTTTARVLRSFNSWLSTNASRGSTGSHATASNTAALDDATNSRTLTETLFDSVLASCWDAGGDPKMVVCRAGNKQIISDFTGRSAGRFNVPVNTIQASADVYVGDFTRLDLVPDRFVRARDVYLLDPEYASLAYLGGGVNQYDLGKVGAADTTVLEAELTLVVKNEAAHGLIADTLATI